MLAHWVQNASTKRSTKTRALFVAVAFGSAVALSACGGGEDDAAPAANSGGGGGGGGGGTTNNAPTIAGSPLGSVLVAQSYSFTPTANDADGNTLTFSIANRPSWATFNTGTGLLSGTPGQGDVGTYANIQISVSDGTATTNLASFSVQVTAVATGSALLSWTPPNENTDGSALTNLNGYRVYWGTQQGNYANSAAVGNNVANYVVEPLTPGTWYFVVTAINGQGIESSYSNVATKTL